MQIVEVKSRLEKKEFIDFPKKLYRGDPSWVCPLDTEIEAVFDPSKNYSFNHGEAARWILRDGGGDTIGRVAAFYDKVRSAAQAQPTGGMGFFEVIENRDAAFMLFDTCREWLKARNLEAMDGPINFGENDNYWGLLVDGFVQQGYGMPYNKQYYKTFFEEYGFRNYFEQYTYHREVFNSNNVIEFPPRLLKIAEWLASRPGYSFEHFRFKNSKKYISDIAEIYNSTWWILKEDFTPLNTVLLEQSLQKAKSFIDEELIWFAYHEGKPISFFVLYPDLNQIIKYFNGRLTLWNMLRFLYFKATHKITRARAVVGGVNPQYQNSGVESAIFYHIYDKFNHKKWYRELELSWVGDYNPKMMAIYRALGSRKAKVHITYRYLINDKIEFIRYKDEKELRQKGHQAASADE